jgi:diguanylate cyclase (GGDEF)-like protein
LFSLTQECEYKALWGRFVILLAQILLLSSISIYTFVSIINSYGQIRKRYRTIGLFGIIMSIFLIVQIFYPLLPIFSMAYMMGTCLLHTFVINDEKEEYKQELEEAFLRETKHYDDLKRAKDLAYTDALTGAKSKVAYNELEDIIDIQIRQKTVKDFKIAIFDVNNLKVINDLYGHKIGDKYIIDSFNIIKNYFSNSKIYRIGGDEFMAFLIDDDYNKSEDLERGFIDEMKKLKSKFDPTIALGIAKFELTDNSFNDVFRRADKLMYDNKTELKRL